MKIKGQGTIVCTPGVVGGAPRIYDTRLTVENVVTAIYKDNAQACIDGYELNFESTVHALQYCAEQACLQDANQTFCHYCSLSKQNELPLDLSLYQEILAGEHLFVKGPNEWFMGSMKDFKAREKGTDWWKEAGHILAKMEGK